LLYHLLLPSAILPPNYASHRRRAIHVSMKVLIGLLALGITMLVVGLVILLLGMP